MPYFEATDGTRLYYSDFGGESCRPVLLAHAWGLNGDMWSAQLPDLIDAGLRAIALDRRGHGRSDRPRGGYDLDTLADDIARLAALLDLDSAVLVGHSMGVPEVVRAVTRHGVDRVAGLVLSAPCGPVLRRGHDNPDGLTEADIEATRRALVGDVGAFTEAISDSAYFGTPPASAALGTWTRQQIVGTPLPVLLATQATFAGVDQRRELRDLRVPTLVLQGSADRSTPLETTGRRVASLVPGAQLAVVEGAGHGVYAAQPARYNAELLAFVASLEAVGKERADTRRNEAAAG